MLFLKDSNIWYIYALQEFVDFKNIFHKTPNPFLLFKRAYFSSHLVLGLYNRNRVRAGNLCRNRVHTKYVQEKWYCKLLVSLYMVFLHLFKHARERDHSTQVDIEPIKNVFENRKSSPSLQNKKLTYSCKHQNLSNFCLPP